MAGKRNPSSAGASAPTPAGDGAKAVDPNVALFASYMKADAQKERDAKKAAREARQQAEAATKLVADKDAAAAEVKRLRGREGVSAEQRAAADDAYKAALAAVVAAETGSAPAWAPPPAEPEAEPEPEADPEVDAEPEPTAAAVDDPAEADAAG